MTHMLLALSLSLAALPVITLERTPCFGSCPAYKISIYGNGLVIYEGKDFVKLKDTADSRITKDQVQELVQEFQRLDYMKLPDNFGNDEKTCPESGTDYPSAITSFNWEGKQKTVHHYLGCRGLPILDQLWKLEDKIDEVVNSKRWVE